MTLMSYRRSREQKRRLKKLCHATQGSCIAGAYYDDDKDGHLRYSPHNGCGYPKYLRRIANRKVRRSQGLPMHGAYRKVYDYWWELT